MRTIEIDKELLLVEVPKNASDFRIINKESLRTALLFSVGITAIPYVLPNADYEIIGLIETPNLDFDFEVQESWVESQFHLGRTIYKNYTKSNVIDWQETIKDSFRTRIQKTIQDNGLYLVNPIKILDGKNISCGEEAEAYNENMILWQESEEKTIKGNLLLIKKV